MCPFSCLSILFPQTESGEHFRDYVVTDCVADDFSEILICRFQIEIDDLQRFFPVCKAHRIVQMTAYAGRS